MRSQQPTGETKQVRNIQRDMPLPTPDTKKDAGLGLLCIRSVLDSMAAA